MRSKSLRAHVIDSAAEGSGTASSDRSLRLYTKSSLPSFPPTRLEPLEKSNEHLFLSSVCLPIWISFLFSVPPLSRPAASFARKTDSQRTYCASFDRMRVYRQLSAGIAKFCVSVGEIESSLRGNVPRRSRSPISTGSDQRNLITKDVVYVTSVWAHPHTSKRIKTQKRTEDIRASRAPD